MINSTLPLNNLFFLTKLLFFYVLLHTKSEQKVIGRFCTPIIFKNLLNILITNCVGRVWNVIRYFLLENMFK